MFSRLKDHLLRLASGGHTAHFAEDDYRLAAAAIAIHAVQVDGLMPPAETDSLHRSIGARFGLNDEDTEALLRAATLREREVSDLQELTGVLNRALEPAERAKVLRMVSGVMRADGALNEFEASLMERITALLELESETGA